MKGVFEGSLCHGAEGKDQGQRTAGRLSEGVHREICEGILALMDKYPIPFAGTGESKESCCKMKGNADGSTSVSMAEEFCAVELAAHSDGKVSLDGIFDEVEDPASLRDEVVKAFKERQTRMETVCRVRKRANSHEIRR